MTVKPSAGTVDSGFAAAGRLDADLKGFKSGACAVGDGVDRNEGSRQNAARATTSRDAVATGKQEERAGQREVWYQKACSAPHHAACCYGENMEVFSAKDQTEPAELCQRYRTARMTA